MKLGLNSRATGPNILVPIGSLSLLIRTAELTSNLMKLPSARPISRLVRTITALATSPFLTLWFQKPPMARRLPIWKKFAPYPRRCLKLF